MTSKSYYKELQSFIDAGRNDNYRKLGNNTYVVITQDSLGNDIIGIQYHNTVIFGMHEDNRYFFNNGGWFTATTKKRINDALRSCGIRHSIVQKNKMWYFNNMKIENGYMKFSPDNEVAMCRNIDCWAFPIRIGAK